MAQTVISLTSFKGGVGKSTLAGNLAGALALNAATTLIDEDSLQSCYQWAHRNGRLQMLVDTEGRRKLEYLSELISSSSWTLIPCGTSGLEIHGTLRLISDLGGAGA